MTPRIASLARAALVAAGLLGTAAGVAPPASALPTAPRPGLTDDGRSDEVVAPPGERGRGVARSSTGRAGAAGAAPGSRTVLVLRVDYTGDPVDPKADGQPYTVAAIRSRLTGAALSASSLLSAQSAGTVSLGGIGDPGGDVTDWLDLPGTPPASGSTCDHLKIRDDAVAAARAKGIQDSSYDQIVIVFADWPDDEAIPGNQGSPCDWSGLGQVPGRITWINGLYTDQDDLDAAVIAHELGHNLGAAHASSVACTDVGGAVVLLRPACALGSAVEYGDPFDLMGGGWPDDAPAAPWLGSTLMSSWHRAQLGQLPAAAEQTVTAGGAYLLDAAGSATGTQLLRLPIGSVRATPTNPVRELVVERRTAGSVFDRWGGAFPPVPDGVLIRLAQAIPAPSTEGPRRSILLDMHPATPTNQDAPLAVGETFEDRAAGVTVSLTSLEGGHAQVQIGGPRFPTPTPIPTATPVPAPVPTAAALVVATPVPSSTPRPTATPTAPGLVQPSTVALLRPSAARGRRVAADGRITVEFPGAKKIVVKAGSKTVVTARRSKASFTLPRALRRDGTVQLRASGGTLASPVRATLRVRSRVAKLTVVR